MRGRICVCAGLASATGRAQLDELDQRAGVRRAVPGQLGEEVRHVVGGKVHAERVGVGVDLVEIEDAGVCGVLERPELHAPRLAPYGGGQGRYQGTVDAVFKSSLSALSADQLNQLGELLDAALGPDPTAW
jgi:hypothetical protein